MQWLEASAIFKSSDEKAPLFELGKKHKHSILKVIFKSHDVHLDKKNEILESTIGDDKSD